MKSLLIVAASLAIPTCVYAQTQTDTLSRQMELNEVVVKSSYVINKADRKLYMPDAEQIKSAANGVDLLRKLNIPSLIVNPMEQTIKLASSGKVDLRINGRAVKDKDIQALEPQTIVRVEYHDNPSLRYGDAEVVIDFIVKNPSSGGSYHTSIGQGLNKGYHDFYNDLKINYKKSEFSIVNNFNPRWNLGQWRNNTEYFTRADGSLYERVEEGSPANATRITNWTGLNYCFSDPDKQLLWVSASMFYENNKHSDYKGILTNSDSGECFNMNDLNSSKSYNPTLDIYYQRNLKKNQLLIFNVVGGVTPSTSQRQYSETPINEDGTTSDILSTDISTDIKSRTYSLVVEADYEQAWQNSRFTGGLRYTGNWSQSEYLGMGQESHTRWNNIYGFGEYWRRFGDKVDLTIGVGATHYRNRTGDITNSSFYIRPKISLRYRANNNSTFRLNMSAYGNTPSISQLSNVKQQIDNVQISTGNPGLRNFTTYRTQAQYEFTKGVFYGYLRSTYRYSPSPIMELKYLNGDNIITSYANHKNSHIFNHEVHLAVNNWKNWVSASAHFGLNRYIMHGNDYTHTYNNPYYNAFVEISHWNFGVGAQITSNYNTFWGESLNGGESAYVLVLTYKLKNTFFLLGCMNPFSNDFKIQSENRNRYAGYSRTSYLQATQQLCVVKVSWNVRWGRKHKSEGKRLNNSGSSETIKAAGKG